MLDLQTHIVGGYPTDRYNTMGNTYEVASAFLQSAEVSRIGPGYAEERVGELGNKMLGWKIGNI